MSITSARTRTLAATAALTIGLLGVASPTWADHKVGHQPPGQSDPGPAQGPDKDKAKDKDDKPDKGRDDKPDKPQKGKEDKDKGGNGNGNPNPGNGDPNPGNQGNGNPNPGNGNGNQGNGNGNPGGNGGGDNGDPAGNNGTVKIAPLGELDGIPNNTPHPGCTFQVEWYGFDEGADIISTVSFAMHSPTKDVGLTVDGPATVFVGGDPASGAGTDTGLDGTEAYTLSFDGEPHPKQGYHVKLTVSTPRSLGNDTKTKVFWVEPCETTAPGSEAPGTESPTTLPSSDEDPAAESPETAVLGASGVAPADAAAPGEVAPAEGVVAEDASDVPTSVDAGADSDNAVVAAVTSPAGLLTIALGLLVAAAAVLLRRRTQV